MADPERHPGHSNQQDRGHVGLDDVHSSIPPQPEVQTEPRELSGYFKGKIRNDLKKRWQENDTKGCAIIKSNILLYWHMVINNSLCKDYNSPDLKFNVSVIKR